MITEQEYREQFLRLIHLLTSGAGEIVEKVKYYSDKPAEYLVSEYGEYCTYEEDDLDDLPGYPNGLIHTYLWDILFGILSIERFMYKLDHRTSHENIAFAVNSLLDRRGFPKMDMAWSQIDKKLPSWDVLNMIAAKLDNTGFRLAFADDGSDSFPLILLNNDDFPELMELAEELGLEIKTYFA